MRVPVHRLRAAAVGGHHQRAREHEIGRCAVAGDRDVVENRDPQQRLDVDVVRVRGERIGEEDHQVDAALGDRGADLLVAPERPAEVEVDRQLQLVGEQLAPVVPVANSSCAESVARL
jgi:hypothetical protein